MLDSTLRPVKDRLLLPAARSPLGRLHPMLLSAIGLAASLGAAVAAWRALPLVAVMLFLLGRVADGLDGLVARRSGRATDVGGLIDFAADTIGYAAIPLGVAFGADERDLWIATAVLLATFYVNVASLGYISTLIEKGRIPTNGRSSPTSAVLPRGLIEGTETIVFFTVALAWPEAAPVVWWIMAVAVAATVVERTRWAVRTLP